MPDYGKTEEDYQREAEALFLGRRIVGVRMYGRHGLLTLDNGTVVKAVPNDGCGGCDRGWYEVVKLTTCDNVITSVRAENDGEWFRLFVLADATEVNALSVSGEDNGWYGNGYYLTVA